MSYLKNKRILITGITGFVGKRLAEKLDDAGANVFGISRTKSGGKIIKADVLDYNAVDKIIRDKKIDVCFHLAAESLVEAGQKDPYNTFKTNIDGTINILESARKNNLERIIVASSSHVYGNNKPPYTEENTPMPSRPYETSKTCTDLIAQSYATNFSLPVLIPRFVNIYGPGDINFNRLIPKTIKSVLSGTSPVMWGGGAKRDYMYIDDSISAYIRLCEVEVSRIGKNRIFNFGSDNILSVKEVIQKIIKLSGKNLDIKKISDQRTLEIDVQFVSWEKARKILKWSPVFSIDEGLLSTVEWYKENLLKQDVA